MNRACPTFPKIFQIPALLLSTHPSLPEDCCLFLRELCLLCLKSRSGLICTSSTMLNNSSALPKSIAKADLPLMLKVFCRTFPITRGEVIFCWFPIQPTEADSEKPVKSDWMNILFPPIVTPSFPLITLIETNLSHLSPITSHKGKWYVILSELGCCWTHFKVIVLGCQSPLYVTGRSGKCNY